MASPFYKCGKIPINIKCGTQRYDEEKYWFIHTAVVPMRSEETCASCKALSFTDCLDALFLTSMVASLRLTGVAATFLDVLGQALIISALSALMKLFGTIFYPS